MDVKEEFRLNFGKTVNMAQTEILATLKKTVRLESETEIAKDKK